MTIKEQTDRKRDAVLVELSRIGGYMRAARHDTAALMQIANNARWQKYLKTVDPEGKLTEQERLRRAEALRKGIMLRLMMNQRPSRQDGC